jgi:hypothetical protein
MRQIESGSEREGEKTDGKYLRWSSMSSNRRPWRWVCVCGGDGASGASRCPR